MKKHGISVLQKKDLTLQIILFLFIWPLLNTSIVAALIVSIEDYSNLRLIEFAGRIWFFFLIAFIVIRLTDLAFDKLAWRKYNKSNFFIQGVLILTLGNIMSPIATSLPDLLEMPSMNFPVAALAILSLEVIIYVTVMLLLEHQKQGFLARLSLQQSELNGLRMQSNPHFLLNTLNLIAFEIDDSNQKAKDLIFDLSDLLKQNIKMAQKNWVKLGDELHLATLFLTLQSKRYKDKLTFDIDFADDVECYFVPSLFLLPVVENAIKYGVEPYSHEAHISILIDKEEDTIHIQVLDTGKEFDASQVTTGNGLRILHETLRLHFDSHYSATLSSEPQGGCMSIRLPACKFIPQLPT